jgi:hypothetical protein
METHMSKKKQSAKTATKKAGKPKAAVAAVLPEQVQPVAQPAVAPKAAREERNGVKRPKPGGKCAAVWEHLDNHGNMEAKELRAVAEAKGWNVNNTLIELSVWRKFNGIAKPRTAAK